jgi:adenylate cyclase
MPQQRHLAAILFTDIVGYTTLMQADEQKALDLIKHYNTALKNTVATHEGKVLNYYGDGSLCTFQSVMEALNCAIDLQKDLQSTPQVPLRIGLHIGEVFFEDGNALGDGVNVASRIQSLGEANTILFSREFYDKIRNHPEFKTVSLGQFEFKNVDEPIEVFALANEGLVVPKRDQMSGKLKRHVTTSKKTSGKQVVIGVSVVFMLIAAFLIFRKYVYHPTDAIEKSIAVLPFVNLSSDPQQEYFADGMMDEILNHLYKIGGLRITSKTSSLTYKGSKKTSTEIADELGVNNLLEGSVQKDGDHIRIIAQLINGKTDDHLWAETYVMEFKDIFSIQSDIAQKISSALKVKIDPAVKERIESKPTENTEAYSLYLRAYDSPDFEDYKLFLEASIKLDSTFANAYSGLAYYWIVKGSFAGGITSQEVLKNAEPLLKKALELNPNLGHAYRVSAMLDLWYKWDFEKVGKDYQKVRQLEPSHPGLTLDFNDYFLAIGKFKEALNSSSEAFKKYNSSNELLIDLALANFFSGNIETALQLMSKSTLIRSDWYFCISYIRICVYSGEFNRAVTAFENQQALLKPYFGPRLLGYSAIAYYKTGHKDSTEKFLNIIKASSEKSQVGSPSFYVAGIYTAMGEKNQAIQWLQKAFRDHEVEMYWLKVEPLFISLHNEPGFKELLTKVGFK